MTGCYLSTKLQCGRNVNESWKLLERRRLWASKPKLNALIKLNGAMGFVKNS